VGVGRVGVSACCVGVTRRCARIAALQVTRYTRPMRLSRPAPWQRPVFPDEAERRALAAERDAAGDPRGRFQIVQLELAQRGRDGTAEAYDLVCAEQRLFALHEAEWLDAFGLLPAELTWFRGLPADLSLPWPRFLQSGAELLRAVAPRGLRLVGDADEQDVSALLACPGLAALERIQLGTLTADEAALLASSPGIGNLHELQLQTSGEGLRALASSPFLPHLKSLRVRAVALSAPDARALVAAPWFRQLECLELVQLWDGDSGHIVAEALTNAPHPPRLRTLELGYDALGGTSLDRLAAWPGLSSVEALDLEGNHLDDRDTATLLASPHLAALKTLRLGPDRLAAGSIAALAGWPGLSRLTTLTLAGPDTVDEHAQLATLCETTSFGAFSRLDLGHGLSAEAASQLASWAGLARFATLSLSGSRHAPWPEDENDALATLARSPHLGGLRSLELRSAVIDHRGLARLLASPSLRDLRHLAVDDCPVGNRGARAIAAWPDATNLETLQLTNAELSDAGAKALAASPSLARLRALSLRGNTIGARGAVALSAADTLGALEVLCLDHNDLGDRGARALARSYRQRWPRLRFLGLADNRVGDAGATAWVQDSGSAGPHLSLEGNDLPNETRDRLRASGLPLSMGPGSREAVYFEALGFHTASG
jgi:hypothetical protein